LIPGDGSNRSIDHLSHEGVGQLLLETDQEIKKILGKYEIEPESIHAIFSRQSSENGIAPKFANLISSDLDADRIDYLSRTARHTGLPYGSVDIDYLLSQIRLDKDNRVCVDSSALRTVEHFLLGRYFDYQQVNFHKTVAALEWALHDVVNELLNLGIFDCSASGIRGMIATGEWNNFDDSLVLRHVRDLEYDSLSETTRAKANAITHRIPPKLIGSFEFLDDRSDLTTYNLTMHFLTTLCDKLAQEFGIPRALWHVWGSWRMSFTKMGTYFLASMTPTDLEESADAIAQMVRIKDGEDSRPISEIPRSLMRILAQSALFSARLYVVLPSGKENLRKAIADRADSEIAAAVGLANWIREQ